MGVGVIGVGVLEADVTGVGVMGVGDGSCVVMGVGDGSVTGVVAGAGAEIAIEMEANMGGTIIGVGIGFNLDAESERVKLPGAVLDKAVDGGRGFARFDLAGVGGGVPWASEAQGAETAVLTDSVGVANCD